MKILLVLVAFAFVMVFGVKFAARLVDAKSETGSILLCLVAQSALAELSRHVASSGIVQFVAAFAAGALVYAWILDTTFKKGVVISLLSSVMIALGFLAIAAMAGLTPERRGEQASLQEMEQRSAQSQARDRAYNDVANRVFIGDGSDFRRCLPRESGPPENFVVYLEILPDGSLGKSRFEPLTDVGECFREAASKRRFPTPPGTYVVKNKMVFKRG